VPKRRPASTYRELAPPAALAPYVRCLWVHEVGPGDGTYHQPVLPDGCLDVVAFDDGAPAVVAGPDTGPVTLDLVPGAVTVGVRFRSGAAPPLLGTDAPELRDIDVPLDEIWGQVGRELIDRAAEAPDASARLAVLVDGLTARARDATPVDPAATGVAEVIATQPGVALPALADRAGMSERQLRRRVEAAVGYPPRTLARVLRFQRFLDAWRSAPPGQRELATLAVLTGYADQAHLTRESRRLAGLPPKALLAWETDRLSPTP
jgi:AraC-like DNA-binding protein